MSNTVETSLKDEKVINAKFIDEFRENGGKLGDRFADGTFLILPTIGARTGRERLTPVAYLPYNGRRYVAAGPGEGGTPRHPAWFHNLVVHPEITIDVGAGTETVHVRPIDGAARAAVWPALLRAIPHFASYDANPHRQAPIVALDRSTTVSPRTRRHAMNEELFKQVEREILAWPGVSKQSFAGGRGQGGFWVPPATLFRFGRREIGHLHYTGEADLPFPRKIHDELIAAGRAQPHGAGFAGVVTYTIRTPEDVSGAVELFRMNYERAQAAAKS